MKKQFNKNLIMSEEQEKQFQSSNTCWICKRLIDNVDEKLRDHCHVTGKFRGTAHQSCKINLQSNKNPVIFHKLIDYNSHSIFCQFNKFDVKIDVIPDR